VGKTLQLLNHENQDEMTSYLATAADNGSGIAAYMLWEQRKAQTSVSVHCLKKITTEVRINGMIKINTIFG